MMHYKPLYGNPMNLGNVDSNSDDADVVISEMSEDRIGTPDIFQQTAETEMAWSALVLNIADRMGVVYGVLAPESFENLSNPVQVRIFDNTMAWFTYFDPDSDTVKNAMFESLLLDIQTLQAEIDAGEESGDLEIIDNEDDIDESVLLDEINRGIESVYPSQAEIPADIQTVLLGAALQIHNEPDVLVTDEAVAEALEAFNNLAFPEYQPEELIACLYLVCKGEVIALDNEELAMVRDDSRPDALCSERNKAIILAAFGEEAANRFAEFCAKDEDARLEQWMNTPVSRNLSALLGVSNDAFEAYVVDAFDESTSAELAAEGSEILQALIGDVIDRTDEEPMSVIQIPRPAQSSDDIEETTAASGLGMLGTAAIVGGAAVGLTLLFRRIKNK